MLSRSKEKKLEEYAREDEKRRREEERRKIEEETLTLTRGGEVRGDSGDWRRKGRVKTVRNRFRGRGENCREIRFGGRIGNGRRGRKNNPNSKIIFDFYRSTVDNNYLVTFRLIHLVTSH